MSGFVKTQTPGGGWLHVGVTTTSDRIVGPASNVGAGDRTAHIFGTFGASATLTLEGSNDNSTWFTIHDLFGAAIAATSAGGYALAENPLYIRGNLTNGDGSTSVTVSLLSVRTK